TLPLDLLAKEQATLFEQLHGRALSLAEKKLVRSAAKTATLSTWQSRWEASPKGRWTHRLIPRLEEWLGRKHGQVNFYLTQVLRGHGCFRGYLHNLGHTDSAACTWCANE
ncbi:hypothetical protein KR054_004846, partial [Drosophila jambulina]